MFNFLNRQFEKRKNIRTSKKYRDYAGAKGVRFLASLAKEQGKELCAGQYAMLVYVAHGICLARFNERLLDRLERVLCIESGPLVASAFLYAGRYGYGTLNLPTRELQDCYLPAKSASSLEIAFNCFGCASSSKLDEFAILKGGPWYKTYYDEFGRTHEREINDYVIQQHYIRMINRKNVSGI